MHNLILEFNEYLEKLNTTCHEYNHIVAKNPELSCQEFSTTKRAIEILKDANIDVQENFCNMKTAFKATITKSSNPSAPHFAILMEYDALPEIGHACGHCASGSMSMLAALTLHSMKDKFDANIDLIGTPDEEQNGGKITMVNEHIFDIYDYAIMVHINSNETYQNCKFMALCEFFIDFYGKTAHAAASPWEGLNALNASILTTHAIDMLRQQSKPDSRLAYNIVDGGLAVNIIPDHSRLRVNLRATTKEDLNTLYDKVKNCAIGCAMATSTTCDFKMCCENYDDMVILNSINDLISETMKDNNIDYIDVKDTLASGSSDIGNVSHVCPSVHPMLSCCDKPYSLHTIEIANIMKDENQINPVIDNGAKIIGHSILKLIINPELLEDIKKEFQSLYII